jgi:hypothetical protein
MILDLLILVSSECYPAIASLPTVPDLRHMRPLTCTLKDVDLVGLHMQSGIHAPEN